MSNLPEIFKNGTYGKKDFCDPKDERDRRSFRIPKAPFFGKRRIFKSDKYIIFIILLLRMSYRNSLVAPDCPAVTTQQIRIGRQ
jgi:hypothetical protein